MENVWHLLNNNNNNTSSGARGQNHHPTPTPTPTPHHHEWELGNLAHHYNFINATPTTTTTTRCFQDGGAYGPVFPHHHLFSSSSSSSSLVGTSSESGGSAYYLPDPHLPSLKLGKRHYFENANNNNNNNDNLVVINRQQESEVIKKVKNLINGQEEFYRGRFGDGSSGCGNLVWETPSSIMGPRCQVEGCSVILVDAKDYYKRHKVCEKHSKAPKVNVVGIEQRFCQQCSRFHGIGEFDESKRSCRRRLAGHNQRRRKTSQDQSAPTNLSSDNNVIDIVNLFLDKVIGGGCGHFPQLNTSSAHSLMSSNNARFNSPQDLSAQSSAALRELIVENRAAASAWHVHDGSRHSWRNHQMEDQTVLQNHNINYFSSEET